MKSHYVIIIGNSFDSEIEYECSTLIEAKLHNKSLKEDDFESGRIFLVNSEKFYSLIDDNYGPWQAAKESKV